ncbi:6-bladed beta-propeller [Parabacteroides faecis]|uniref:6-bladed beta-propeller n=1 Tax=Parabacteroides faecis TaxID=1217282 RepID=UPI002164D8CC|nr:6-bladed beta-propeller [Parabacteroides faecis]MCS2892372.1 6-bladed beta-propeller [Parabacteroides faecis]UVQ48987.1 6-bladed beta-propeller [Parabacteroides faecis]
MKRVDVILAIFLIIATGCGGNKKSNSSNNNTSTVATQDTFITVDVSKKYPLKELILQDIMDVEYIPLESTDEFLCQGVVQAIGKEIILVKNVINDGDIFIFDRNGKGLRKFNRKGQGSEEYIFNLSVFLDEDKGEIYVDEVIRNVLVYDLYGNFLRNIHRDKVKWINASNYNSDFLIARESPSAQKGKDTDNQLFVLISKQNGNIVKDFRIYFEKKIEWGITNHAGNTGAAPRPYPIIPYHDGWLLMEPSSDTIFRISQDYSLSPFMARTPSIQSMKPAVFLLPCIFTDRYHFMETITMEANFLRNEGFPKTQLVYDKKENSLFEYTMLNNDFPEKGPVNFTMQETTNSEIAFWQKMEPHELIEAYAKGQLKGKLKDIAAELQEDSNPVIMLVKYRKVTL